MAHSVCFRFERALLGHAARRRLVPGGAAGSARQHRALARAEVNVIVMGATEDAEPSEFAIPEQFVSRYRGGRWVTEPVSHSGG